MPVLEAFAAVYGLAITFALLYIAGQWIAAQLDRCTERRIRARG